MAKSSESPARGRFVWALCCLPVVGLIIGCGEARTVPIEAVLRYDGEPLTDAGVSFIRNDGEGGRPAFGGTDAEGIATFTSYEPNDGVPPGSYRVVVIKDFGAAPAAPEATGEGAEAMVAASSGFAGVRPGKRRSAIPPIYSDATSTPLTCEVVRGTLRYEFDLTSSP